MSEMEVDPPSVWLMVMIPQINPPSEIERAKVPLYCRPIATGDPWTSEAVGPPYSEQMRLLFTQIVARVAWIYWCGAGGRRSRRPAPMVGLRTFQMSMTVYSHLDPGVGLVDSLGSRCESVSALPRRRVISVSLPTTMNPSTATSGVIVFISVPNSLRA